MTMAVVGEATRAELAAAQAALVAALVDGAPAPNGFLVDRLEATTRALLDKRAREVAEAWPATARSLGPDFRRRFLAYAAATRPFAGDRVWDDGLRFVTGHVDRRELDEAAVAELLVGRSTAVLCREGSRQRRLPWIGVGRSRSGRVVGVWRLPGLPPRLMAARRRRVG